MNQTRHLIISLIMAFAIMAAGTAGYMIIERWDFLDSLYMTMITISTVGYMEVHPTSVAGRWYTIGLVFFGVGFTLYVAGALVQFMVEGRIRRLMGRSRKDRQIKRLKEHHIICGYGRIGRVLVEKLREKPLPVVVIEKSPDLVPVMDKDGILYISGEATDEANLQKAGIDRAKGLVAALADDTNNVFLTLTARMLNPKLFIVARASKNAVKRKLEAAGADRVQSPYEMGAASMADRIIRPTVTNFLNLAFADNRRDIQMEEIPVAKTSRLANTQLKDSGIRQSFNLIIIAIKQPDGEMSFNPPFDALIRADDTLIAVGEAGNLKKLETILNPAAYRLRSD